MFVWGRRVKGTVLYVIKVPAVCVIAGTLMTYTPPPCPEKKVLVVEAACALLVSVCVSFQ